MRELGTRVDGGERVEVDGRAVQAATTKTFVVLHKPAGVMTTMRDPQGRRTVADLVRAAGVSARVVPVGRLDYDTAGVLLLTDDGDAAHALTHPRFGVEKTYRATVRGRLDADDVAALRAGVRLDDGRAAPAQLRVVAANRGVSAVDLTIHEGRNRQVRRMFEELGHPVLGLVRLRFGPVRLGELAPGAVRPLTERERAAIDRIVADAGEEGD